jgi:hypothetical protein
MDGVPLRDSLPRVFAGRARPALEALAALDRELTRAVHASAEHNVAHARLGWWREELGRLRAGQPLHPVTRQLHALAGDAPDWALLTVRLHAADLELAGVVPASLDELEAASQRSHGTLWQLNAEILAGARSADLASYGAALGTAVGLLEHGLAGAATALGADAGAGALTARIRARLDAAEAAAPRSHRAALVAGFVAGALTRAALARAPLREPPAFVQLWIGWRAARRAVRD